MKPDQMELVPAQNQQAAPVRQQPVELAAIMRAAQDPSVDVAKVEQLIGLYERMTDRQAEQAFNDAMVVCQAEMPRVAKDGRVINHKTGALQSRYATIERIDATVRPIYERHGFSISVSVDGVENGKYWVRAIVRHSGGHKQEFRIPLALDQSGAKNDTQGMGSTMSYARRYLLCSIFNIITEGEDTDGAPAKSQECISADQLGRILDLINSTGSSESKLLAWVNERTKGGVTTLEQIPAGMYQEIVTLYQRKAGK